MELLEERAREKESWQWAGRLLETDWTVGLLLLPGIEQLCMLVVVVIVLGGGLDGLRLDASAVSAVATITIIICTEIEVGWKKKIKNKERELERDIVGKKLPRTRWSHLACVEVV